MKQIYPITVLVLVAITVCCSVIGVRPAAVAPVGKASVQTTISQSPRLASEPMVASGQ